MATTKKKRIAAAIAKCRDRDGNIRPKRVVEEARDPENPLHGEFEWNDTRAANLQRLQRAAELIREVRLQIVHEDVTLVAPFYVCNPNLQERSYLTVTSITRANDKREVLLAELQRIKGTIRRGMALAVLFKLQDHFESALREIIAAETRLGRE